MPSQIKGTAIQIYLEWLKAALSPAEREAVLARLPEASHKLIVEQLLPSVTYAYAAYGELLEATRAVLGGAYERLALDHGRYAADVLLAGVYRNTVKAGDVQRTLLMLARGWKVYFDTGEIQIAEETPGRVVFVIADAQYHPLHPPISAGYVQRACEIAGAARVEVELHGQPPRVEMAIVWS